MSKLGARSRLAHIDLGDVRSRPIMRYSSNICGNSDLASSASGAKLIGREGSRYLAGHRRYSVALRDALQSALRE